MELLITKITSSGNYAVTVVQPTPIGYQKIAFGIFLTSQSDTQHVGKKFPIKSYREKELEIVDPQTSEIIKRTQIIPTF